MKCSTSVLTAFFTVLFLFAGTEQPCFSQKRYIIKKVSVDRRAAKPDANQAIRTLATKITRGASSDAQKTEAIFNWLATNIDYDNELRLNTTLQKQIYTTEDNVMLHALKRKKALCGGYAFLFKSMCAAVGVDAAIIHGYTKQSHQQQKVIGDPEHTWNAVYLNGEWKLLDITWAVSHGSAKKPQRFWYLTEPSDFNRTHVPQIAKWKLADQTATK